MNRRTFITSLLATTAAIPLAKAAPLEPSVTMRFIGYGGGFSATAVYTAFYMSDEAPRQFTGFIPAWSNEK